jgi:hypothetical protein
VQWHKGCTGETNHDYGISKCNSCLLK